MKVLQVCAYAAPYEGNFMKSLYALEEELIQRGYEIIYAFTERNKNIPWTIELEKTHKVYYLPLAKARIKPQTYYIFHKIYRENPDIVIAHSHFELYDVPMTVSAPKTVKIFWHLHDSIDGIDKGFYHYILKIQYDLCSGRAHLLAVSEKLKTFAVKLGFSHSNISYIPNGIDLSRITPVSDEFMTKQYDFLMFGWNYMNKGVDLAVRAAQKCNQLLSMAVVGKKDTWEKLYEEFENKLKFLTKLEPVEDINRLYNNTRCFLHVSRHEGLSYALLEVLYAGLPVIVSDIPENIFAAEFPTVIFVKNNNYEALYEAMNKVLSKEIYFTKEDFEQTRNRIAEKYSLSIWTVMILNQYGIAN